MIFGVFHEWQVKTIYRNVYPNYGKIHEVVAMNQRVAQYLGLSYGRFMAKSCELPSWVQSEMFLLCLADFIICYPFLRHLFRKMKHANSGCLQISIRDSNFQLLASLLKGDKTGLYSRHLRYRSGKLRTFARRRRQRSLWIGANMKKKHLVI